MTTGVDKRCRDSVLDVLQVIASTRVDHGGTSRSVPALCSALAANGLRVQLLTGRTPGIRSNLPDPPVITHLIDESRFFGRWFTGRAFLSKLHTLYSESRRPCVVHDHGIWLPSNRAVAKFAEAGSRIRIVSPRGMVSQWAMDHGGIRKSIAWKVYQRNDLRSASGFHATSWQEAEELRQLGFRQPIAVISNGIDLPESMPSRNRADDKKQMIFLSRIHPKKGLLNLVTAWHHAKVGDAWQLVLVGPNESGHQQEVEREITRLGLSSYVRFAGEADDEYKWQLFANADLFILPSFSENFGIVVAEALAAGLPVITTTGTPWQSLSTAAIGWCVPPTVDELVKAIREACSLPEDQRVTMGRRAAAWCASRFQWSGIASQMNLYYRWLTEGGEAPDFVDAL